MPRTFPQAQQLAEDCIFLTGYLVLDGSGNISSSSFTGCTPSKTGTGTYQLLLDTTYAEFCGANVTLVEATPTNLHCHVTAEAVKTQGARTIALKFSADSAPTTGVNPVTATMHVVLSLRDTARAPAVQFP